MYCKKIIRIILLYFFIALDTSTSFAQSLNIEFDHYDINDGLSNNYVNSIFQDSKGFMWISTANGLNRFDGFSFKTYYTDSKDNNSIPGNNVNHLVEDTLGRIWTMTNAGISYYDRKSDQFMRKHLVINGKLDDKVDGNSCIIDSKGFLWVGSSNGI